MVTWIIAISFLNASYVGPYVYGFDPAPYPKISWSGALCGWLPGDFDWDGDVDPDDLLPFEMCASGSGVYLRLQYDDGSHAACWMCDFDDDWDVDQVDFAQLQICMGAFLGDVNGDDVVDETDYNWVVYCSEHESEEGCLPECNLDGSNYPLDEITLEDIQMEHRLVFHEIGP